MSQGMEKALYRGILVVAPLLAVAAAVVAFLGIHGAALGLLALVVAALPVLVHLQTRQLVLTQARADKRSVERILGKMPKSAPAPPATAKAVVDLKPVLEAQTDLARDLSRLEEKVESSSAEEVSTFANEIRRESRMLRLTAAQLVEEMRASERD